MMYKTCLHAFSSKNKTKQKKKLTIIRCFPQKRFDEVFSIKYRCEHIHVLSTKVQIKAIHFQTYN